MEDDIISHTNITQANINEIDLYLPRLHKAIQYQHSRISVMGPLGPNLKSIISIMNGKPFSLKTTLQIGISLISCYEQIHRAGYIHHSTKPVNFCIGGTLETRHKIYVVDFGRAYPSLDENNKHISQQHDGSHDCRVPFQFSSPSEVGCSRRDEIASLGLMLLQLHSAIEMPWLHYGIDKRRDFEILSSSGLSLMAQNPFAGIIG